MFAIQITCPHCGTTGGINLFAASEYTADCPPSVLAKEQTQEPSFSHKPIPQARFSAAGTCVFCWKPVLLELDIDRDYLRSMLEYIKDHEQRYNGPTPTILEIWPKPKAPYSHPSLPEDVRKDFLSLQQALPLLNGSPWMAISICRTILESAVKHLEGEGGTLNERLTDLKSKGILSCVLFDWCQNIKKFGNAAVHDRSGTVGEAEEMVDFIKLFLQYTFELPDRVQEIRAKIPTKTPQPSN